MGRIGQESISHGTRWIGFHVTITPHKNNLEQNNNQRMIEKDKKSGKQAEIQSRSASKAPTKKPSTVTPKHVIANKNIEKTKLTADNKEDTAKIKEIKHPLNKSTRPSINTAPGRPSGKTTTKNKSDTISARTPIVELKKPRKLEPKLQSKPLIKPDKIEKRQVESHSSKTNTNIANQKTTVKENIVTKRNSDSKTIKLPQTNTISQPKPIETGLSSPKPLSNSITSPTGTNLATDAPINHVKETPVETQPKKKRPSMIPKSKITPSDRLLVLKEFERSLFYMKVKKNTNSINEEELHKEVVDIEKLNFDELKENCMISKAKELELKKKVSELNVQNEKLNKQLMRQRRIANPIPKQTSNVPPSLEANINLRFQYQQKLDAERKKYQALMMENERLGKDIDRLSAQLTREKNQKLNEEHTTHLNEISNMKIKIRELQHDNQQLVELLCIRDQSLEKLSKENEAINSEMTMMRQLKMHLSSNIDRNPNSNRSSTVDPNRMSIVPPDEPTTNLQENNTSTVPGYLRKTQRKELQLTNGNAKRISVVKNSNQVTRQQSKSTNDDHLNESTKALEIKFIETPTIYNSSQDIEKQPKDDQQHFKELSKFDDPNLLEKDKLSENVMSENQSHKLDMQPPMEATILYELPKVTANKKQEKKNVGIPELKKEGHVDLLLGQSVANGNINELKATKRISKPKIKLTSDTTDSDKPRVSFSPQDNIKIIDPNEKEIRSAKIQLEYQAYVQDNH